MTSFNLVTDATGFGAVSWANLAWASAVGIPSVVGLTICTAVNVQAVPLECFLTMSLAGAVFTVFGRNSIGESEAKGTINRVVRFSQQSSQFHTGSDPIVASRVQHPSDPFRPPGPGPRSRAQTPLYQTGGAITFRASLETLP